MNLIIRNVPKSIDNRITELAKACGKSKQAYLLEQIRQIALYPELKEQSDSYSSLVHTVCTALDENTRAMREFIGGGDDEESIENL